MTQESFLKFYVALREGQQIENPRAWLYTVAHNLAVNARLPDARVLESERDRNRSNSQFAPEPPVIGEIASVSICGGSPANSSVRSDHAQSDTYGQLLEVCFNQNRNLSFEFGPESKFHRCHFSLQLQQFKKHEDTPPNLNAPILPRLSSSLQPPIPRRPFHRVFRPSSSRRCRGCRQPFLPT